MTHSVQLLVGRGDAVAAFLSGWAARAVDLTNGWQAIPIEDALFELIEASAPGAERPPELDLSPRGLEQAMLAATAAGGALAYVETDYWGGQGGQSAMAFADGREVMAPQRARGGFGAINQALRAIGVEREIDKDEFDTIGLGARRTMDDYSPEGPRRLRVEMAAIVEGAGTNPQPTLPIWVMLAVVAAAVAIGITTSLAK